MYSGARACAALGLKLVDQFSMSRDLGLGMVGAAPERIDRRLADDLAGREETLDFLANLRRRLRRRQLVKHSRLNLSQAGTPIAVDAGDVHKAISR